MKQRLKEIREKGLFREFRTITSACAEKVKLKGKESLMLASNNYLGLNTHPEVIAAAKKALEKYGLSNVASRLVVNLDIYEKLEKALAKYKKTQAALVYATGFATNVGIISTIMNKGDFILSDELNHASIIDGCRLSKAKTFVYQHINLADLKRKLAKTKGKNVLVVTDSVFSMDGDCAKLKEIIKLKKEYAFVLMVDDAHATGIINTNLKGIDIHMGTLSKSLGSQGGFVAGTKELIDFLHNTSRPFIYSTGLSPANTAGALASLNIIKKDKKAKTALLKNAAYLRKGLAEIGFNVKGSLQIIPLMVGDNKKTMQFQKLLEKEGIFVTGIRYPTVQTARLRICVMATHTKKQLDTALAAFKKTGIKLGLIPHAQK